MITHERDFDVITVPRRLYTNQRSVAEFFAQAKAERTGGRVWIREGEQLVPLAVRE